jgi:hypothetical protein
MFEVKKLGILVAPGGKEQWIPVPKGFFCMKCGYLLQMKKEESK